MASKSEPSNIALCLRTISYTVLLGLFLDPEDGLLRSNRTSSELHGIINPETILSLIIAARTSNPTYESS
jgi:hypothetical protein